MGDRQNRALQRTRRTPKVFNSRYAPKQKINWAQYRALWPLGLVLVVVVGFYILSQLPAFRVETIEISGPTTPMVVTALQKLKGDSLLSGSLQADVAHAENSLPILSALNCRRGIPATLKCSVTLRSPALFWLSGGKTYAVDQNGFVFGEQAATTGSLVVEDRSSAAVRLGETVASAQAVKNYIVLFKSLSDSHLTTTELFVGDTLFQCGAVLTASTDSNVPFAAKSPISALFTFDRPINSQVATLVQILKDKHDAISDHVDLRVPGSAYIQ